ncbi:MAG: hypothetical protein AAF702_35020, partial [Chloroflexota bacterium]
PFLNSFGSEFLPILGFHPLLADVALKRLKNSLTDGALRSTIKCTYIFVIANHMIYLIQSDGEVIEMGRRQELFEES